MNARISLALLFGICSSLVQHAAAAETVLQYKFGEVRTNAYRVTVEAGSENQPIKLEGTIIVGTRPSGGDTGYVFFRGRFQHKREAMVRPGGFPMFPPGAGPFGRFGPGGNPWMNALHMPHMMGMHNEAQIDTRGRVLRSSGVPELPLPIEDFAALLFPVLPEESAKDGTFESTITVDENFSPRPGFHHPGMRQGNGRVIGTRTETVKTSASEDGDLRLERTVEFRSWLESGGEPRLSFSLNGDYLFDPAAGAVQSARIEGTAITSTLEFIQRTPVTVQFEKLEGDDWIQAMSESGLDRPAALGDADIPKLIAEIESDEQPRQTEAAGKILAANLTKDQAAQLLEILLPRINDPDHMMRQLAGRVLSKAATHEHVPVLLKMLKQEDMGQTYEVVQALGRLKDKRAIQPLADLIAYGNNASHAAGEALAEFGPIVEETALELLKEKHADTRRHACQILQRSGTAKSIEPLQQMIATGDPNLIHSATEALRGIRTRGEEAAKLVF